MEAAGRGRQHRCRGTMGASLHVKGPSTVQVLDSFLDAMGDTPLVRLRAVTRGLRPAVLAKLEMLNPGGIGEGPDRDPDDRGGRARGETASGRHDRRADVRQHRPRIGDRGRRQGVRLHLRDAGQDEPGEDRAPARVRGRGRDLPDRRGAGVARVLLLGGRPARVGDPGRVPAEPVLQPRQSADARGDDRSGDLATDRRHDRRLRLRGRDRRHDHRRRPLPETDETVGHDRGRRHGGLRLHRRHPPSVPHGGDRRGFLARHLRSRPRRPMGARPRP